VILDGEQDESFLVLHEKRLFFHFFLLGLVLELFFSDENGGVFVLSACTREFLLETRDREVSLGTDVHF